MFSGWGAIWDSYNNVLKTAATTTSKTRTRRTTGTTRTTNNNPANVFFDFTRQLLQGYQGWKRGGKMCCNNTLEECFYHFGLKKFWWKRLRKFYHGTSQNGDLQSWRDTLRLPQKIRALQNSWSYLFVWGFEDLTLLFRGCSSSNSVFVFFKRFFDSGSLNRREMAHFARPHFARPVIPKVLR